MIFVSMGAFAQSNEPLEGDVNNDGKVDVADIVKVIDIMQNSTPQPAVTYYWYVGQTDPANISEIGQLASDYISGGGWYELGITVPETITQLVKGGDSTKYWYVAIPITDGTTLKPVTSDMTTLDTSISAMSTKTFIGGEDVIYQIYWYGGFTAARNTFRFAKK